jgi:hypothetical protein
VQGDVAAIELLVKNAPPGDLPPAHSKRVMQHLSTLIADMQSALRAPPRRAAPPRASSLALSLHVQSCPKAQTRRRRARARSFSSAPTAAAASSPRCATCT